MRACLGYLHYLAYFTTINLLPGVYICFAIVSRIQEISAATTSNLEFVIVFGLWDLAYSDC